MAEKLALTDDNVYGAGYLGHDPHKMAWTEGLPHDFRGWGPQTPDPDAPSHSRPAPQVELFWRGEHDHPNHYVWRFDGRRPRHH